LGVCLAINVPECANVSRLQSCPEMKANDFTFLCAGMIDICISSRADTVNHVFSSSGPTKCMIINLYQVK
jgi:hypothetical protein